MNICFQRQLKNKGKQQISLHSKADPSTFEFNLFIALCCERYVMGLDSVNGFEASIIGLIVQLLGTDEENPAR